MTNTSNTNPTLYLMVGFPGCGKSTWVMKQASNHVGEYVILSTDKYIEEMAVIEKKTYGEVFQKYIGLAEKQLEASLEYAVKNNLDIYWDQTNLTKKTRAKKLAKVPNNYKKQVSLFEVSDKVLKEQLEKRVIDGGKYIPWGVIENMQKTYDKPSFSEEDFDTLLVIRKN